MTVGRRAEQQIRNRERILAAAREEFAQTGYRDAKIDRIAARAGLTRGAVYSNFPSKRALGLTVAAELLSAPPQAAPSATHREQVAVALAQTWLARLPMAGPGDTSQIEHLRSDLYAEMRQDRDLRDACAALLQLDAILLARVFEQGEDPDTRAVRAASALLTVLRSADTLSACAPGFIDPFTVVTTCAALATTEFKDRWAVPHESIVPAVRMADEAWAPPTGSTDLITNAPMSWDEDGIIAILGLRQAARIEQALRMLPEESGITLVLVSDDSAERAPMARMILSELLDPLRRSTPAGALTGLSLVLDHDGAVARAAGLRSATDDTHIALRIKERRIIERAEGAAACHAIAAKQSTRDEPTSTRQ